MLVIGRQVINETNRRMDLVALDNTGAIILIEVKRDPKDMMYRKDNAEIQAVRYAASLATLRTIDDLVATHTRWSRSSWGRGGMSPAGPWPLAVTRTVWSNHRCQLAFRKVDQNSSLTAAPTVS
jgi:hypothetical protein